MGSEGRDDWWAHDNSKKWKEVSSVYFNFFAQALCMNELKGCQRFSMGPNFIYFGAQKWGNPVFHWTLCTIPRRYGYRPIPSEIDTAELLKLRETLVGMKNDVHLMDKWSVWIVFRIKTFLSQWNLLCTTRYRKDENKTPPESVLLPITTHLKLDSANTNLN